MKLSYVRFAHPVPLPPPKQGQNLTSFAKGSASSSPLGDGEGWDIVADERFVFLKKGQVAFATEIPVACAIPDASPTPPVERPRAK